jgi:uncharacterized membrane protein YdjX (TVP38/TMEM64 family)
LKLSKQKITVLSVIAVLVACIFYFDLGSYLSFESIKKQQASLEAFYSNNALLMIAGYFLFYVLAVAINIPGAAMLTLLGGAIFGLFWGTVIVSFASSIGATLAFIGARYFLKDWVQEKFGSYLSTINKGVQDEGAFYLFTLRLVPVVPFFVINLVMGLMPMKTSTFYWVSQIGMLAGTFVYVNAGTQLATLESPAGILSPALLASFVLLGIFPIIAKKVVGLIKKK